MAEGTRSWTEDQVVEAFNAFRNKNAEESSEEAEKMLRKQLRKQRTGLLGPDDILNVAGKMVPGHCVVRMANVVIDWLDANGQPSNTK